MSDYISRQAAISAICNACGKIDCDKMDKCEKLQLPPANCSEFPNNSDTISRQAALDALDRIFDNVPMELTTEILRLRRELRGLSPADVVPVVHGKWIDHDGNKVQLNEHGETCGTCFCSRCGEWLVASDEYAVKGYFCPNCGAKMDGEE